MPNGQVQEERIARKGKYRRIRESRGEPNYLTLWHSPSKLMSLRTNDHNTSTPITKRQISHNTKTNSTSIQQQTSRCYTLMLTRWWSFLTKGKTALRPSVGVLRPGGPLGRRVSVAACPSPDGSSARASVKGGERGGR
jgi:hypothetical protein